MLTDEDIKKLKETLVSKEDLAKIVTLDEFDKFQEEVKEEFSALRESVQALTVSVDRLVKAVSDLKTEYTAIFHQLTRHEKWIQQLADKIGVKLEY